MFKTGKEKKLVLILLNTLVM